MGRATPALARPVQDGWTRATKLPKRRAMTGSISIAPHRPRHRHNDAVVVGTAITGAAR